MALWAHGWVDEAMQDLDHEAVKQNSIVRKDRQLNARPHEEDLKKPLKMHLCIFASVSSQILVGFL